MAKPAWITVDPASGTGNKTVRITASKHTGRLERTGTVTFHAAGGLLTNRVEVKQEAAPLHIDISTLTLDGSRVIPSGEYNEQDGAQYSAEVPKGGVSVGELKVMTNAEIVRASFDDSTNFHVIGVYSSLNGDTLQIDDGDQDTQTFTDADPGAAADYEAVIRFRVDANASASPRGSVLTVSARRVSSRTEEGQIGGIVDLSSPRFELELQQGADAATLKVNPNSAQLASGYGTGVLAPAPETTVTVTSNTNWATE